jgi:RHS repeat-associated protein
VSGSLSLSSTIVAYDGTTPEWQGYMAWGETRFGDVPTQYQYTSQYKDNSINLYWYGSRWYDPELGRWAQPDSIVPGFGEGGNTNAVGFYGISYYSSLTVDYHENQLLELSNHENRIKLQSDNSIFHLCRQIQPLLIGMLTPSIIPFATQIRQDIAHSVLHSRL